MVIEELYTRLGFQVDPKGIDKAKSALGGFKKFIGGLALGAGFTMLAKTGIEAAMTMEGLTAQFTVMTGSAERAKNVIGEIAAFAEKTPFDKLGLSNAAKTLMAFGLEAESVVPTLKMLGDVAGADQNRLNSLALVFGQIQSAGRLMGQDLLQLINQGFNPLTVISKQTGLSMAELKKAMEQGKITSQMVADAFKLATSEGGMFFGNLEAQSQTLQGRISTLKDNFVTALQNMAEAFLPLLKSGVEMLIAFDWTPIVESVRSFGNALSSISFDDLVIWIRRLSIAVISFATRDLQVTLINAFKQAMISGVATFKTLSISMTSFKNIAIGSIKAIGLAMKTSLGPIGLALMAIEGFVEAYNWLQHRAERKATEKELESARGYFKSKNVYHYATDEEALAELEKTLETRRKEASELQEIAAKGGREGITAAARLKGLSSEIKGREKFFETLKIVYEEDKGIKWTPRTGMVADPRLSSDTTAMEKRFAELEKTIKDSTNATIKQTKATEDNTAVQKKFDISSLSRQAFDAAFNVKLRELTLGTI